MVRLEDPAVTWDEDSCGDVVVEVVCEGKVNRSSNLKSWVLASLEVSDSGIW